MSTHGKAQLIVKVSKVLIEQCAKQWSFLVFAVSFSPSLLKGLPIVRALCERAGSYTVRARGGDCGMGVAMGFGGL